ncbi:putative actin-related protein 2 [Leptomonas seymouri]|uniref:Putative actin-related protein 2 n=1 Tax=Leptomonas seymouri TaxID=5684 RepID=A0A0N1IM09_LEPSE|nr:putative actin-related protein 2 [Leptomonas seymouri]|eukprot:KPI89168.1 putative actin-related protein 2 [Leptomonas seymouri]
MTLAPVVLDNGTGSIKCGCAGVSPLPLIICPTVIGRPSVDAYTLNILHSSKDGSTHLDADRIHRAQLLQKEFICRDELYGLRATADMSFPIKNGVIQNMDAMRELWDYMLCQRLPQMVGTSAGSVSAIPRTKREDASAGLNSGLEWLEDRLLLLTQPPNLSAKQRGDIMEVFFEEYHFKAIQATPQGILALFANGAEHGVVVECGEGLTHCTPIFDGIVLTTAQRRLDLGGRDVTNRVKRLLCGHQGGLRRGAASKNDLLMSSAHAAPHPAVLGGVDDAFRQLKERHCYVSVDPRLDQHLARATNALQRTCVLPDGAICRLGAERFTAPEVLFDPSLMDVDSPGISAVLWESIEAADVDVRKVLYESIVLSGGSTLFPGFGARLTRDMKELYLTEKLKGDMNRMARCPIQVNEPPRRQYMAYMGGALVAELSADQPEMWTSLERYQEDGVSAVVARYQRTA